MTLYIILCHRVIILKMFSSCNLLQTSVTEWHFEYNMITLLLHPLLNLTILQFLLYVYIHMLAKKSFMRELCLSGIESCTCMPAEELIRRFVLEVFYHLIANVSYIVSLASQICDITRATCE